MLLALLVATTAGPSLAADPPEGSTPPAVGADAPSIALRDPSGAMYILSDYVGPGAAAPRRALVLNFFATWCAPCQAELPVLGRLQARFGPQGVDVLLIDVGEKPAEVEAWLPNAPAGVRVLLDRYAVTAERYGAAKRIPQTFVVLADGRVALHVQGADEDLESKLSSTLERALVTASGG